MTLVSGTTPITAPTAGRLSEVAGEAERLARTDPAAARARLHVLRDLVAAHASGEDPGTDEAARIVRILDQLDADLGTGAVRSITGLARRVRRLEKF